MFREDIDTSNCSIPYINFDINGGSIPENLTTNEFYETIHKDGHAIASCKNMHRHSYTCKKYRSTQCRFGCPWPLEPITRADETG